jgi:hypothetical protein
MAAIQLAKRAGATAAHEYVENRKAFGRVIITP